MTETTRQRRDALLARARRLMKRKGLLLKEAATVEARANAALAEADHLNDVLAVRLERRKARLALEEERQQRKREKQQQNGGNGSATGKTADPCPKLEDARLETQPATSSSCT